MQTVPRGHDCWIIIGKDDNGIQKEAHFLHYTRREAIQRFREMYNCIGKHGVILSVIPKFKWDFP
ncbi:hypothetical protein B0187_00995 [Haemophilus paracuniculus]|uniref:Uncharacterized protein n=1 Tax=Haemophilus paracuniculus TaxID=734 RepID=A0A1T0AVR5_9PAST|nr:hypothetical protein B0187_00995 [Haemophilus paracuniculus]